MLANAYFLNDFNNQNAFCYAFFVASSNNFIYFCTEFRFKYYYF